MGPHYNLLNTGFLIFKKTSPEEEERKKMKEAKEQESPRTFGEKK